MKNKHILLQLGLLTIVPVLTYAGCPVTASSCQLTIVNKTSDDLTPQIDLEITIDPSVIPANSTRDVTFSTRNGQPLGTLRSLTITSQEVQLPAGSVDDQNEPVNYGTRSEQISFDKEQARSLGEFMFKESDPAKYNFTFSAGDSKYGRFGHWANDDVGSFNQYNKIEISRAKLLSRGKFYNIKAFKPGSSTGIKLY